MCILEALNMVCVCEVEDPLPNIVRRSCAVKAYS